MSATSARVLVASSLLFATTSLGCWEQNLPDWFPQMKRQPAVQAYEIVGLAGQVQGFSPPEGTLPVGLADTPDPAALPFAEQDAIPNPQPATFASLKNGEVLYQRYCSTCHGVNGLGDGAVAGSSPFAPNAKGPLAMVLPLAGPMSMSKVFTDGHIYTSITLGRGRMPNYRRIPAEDRWDIVNYIREMNTEEGSR